jgi:hypothetical protein
MSACLSRWTRPCFSQDAARPRRIDRVRHAPRARPVELSFRIAPPRVLRPCVQRPNATTHYAACAAHFRARSKPSFCVPEPSEFRADTPFLRAPKPGGGAISSGALLGATGGTQTHSRRTGRKLGRLRYARQGLVRVPESNTKYGGLGGITGVCAAPVMGQVSVSPQGFPNKKMSSWVWIPASPRCSQASYFFPASPLIFRTHVTVRES